MEIWEQLRAPFPPERIHWRIGSKTKDGKKARLLAYLNARDVMERLDEVLGPENWQDIYDETHKRLLCTLSVRIGDQWVSKSDGAGDSNMEGEKGGISDAFKRAAVKFGVGRYLYDTASPWVDLDERGNIPKNFNGAQYLKAPGAGSDPVKYMHLVLDNWDTINEAKGYLANDEVEQAVAVFNELPDEVKRGLWKSFTKGGCWTVEEYNKFKGSKAKGKD